MRARAGRVRALVTQPRWRGHLSGDAGDRPIEVRFCRLLRSRFAIVAQTRPTGTSAIQNQKALPTALSISPGLVAILTAQAVSGNGQPTSYSEKIGGSTHGQSPSAGPSSSGARAPEQPSTVLLPEHRTPGLHLRLAARDLAHRFVRCQPCRERWPLVRQRTNLIAQPRQGDERTHPAGQSMAD